MTRRRIAPVVALVSAAALALALSACAPDGGAPAPSGSTTTPSSGTPSASASASPSPSPSASASADAGADATCIVGQWTMGQDELTAFYEDVNTLMAGAGVTFAPEGTAALTLGADGTFVWAPDAVVTAQVSGTTILIDFGGQITGTYTATGDHIATDTQSTDALTVSATIDGAPTDAGSISQDIAGAPVTDASYTCTSDTLTLENALGGGTATSVLHRP